MIYGTFLVGIIALVISVPVSIGIALFVTEIAPRRISKPIIYVVDLLAAIPSVVYGLWALAVLTQPLADIYQSISDATSGIPIIERPHRRAQHERAQLHDRRDHRRDHDHADHHVVDPRGVRHRRRRRSRKRRYGDGRDAVGDDPRLGVPAQPRRRGRRR